MNFKSNDEITNSDLYQIHKYTVSLYVEMTGGRFEDINKTRVKDRIRHLLEIVEK